MPQTEHSEQLADILGMVVDDYLERRAAGEHPHVEEYASRHPQHAEIIRQSLRALEVVGDSVSPGHAVSDDTNLGRVKSLGDFRLLGELGRGGMGVVYEAEQISLGRKVALKVLPFAALVQNHALKRFQNEVRAVAALDHPNIVSVYSVGEERGVHYYAMQLIRGRSLADVISSVRKVRDQGHVLDGQSISQITSMRRRNDDAHAEEDAIAPSKAWERGMRCNLQL